MSKKARLWYLSLAPVFFVLSWLIGHRLHERIVEHAKGMVGQPNRALLYESIFTAVYIAV